MQDKCVEQIIAYDVPNHLRWDDDIVKTFLETAPYYFSGQRPKISGRQISFRCIKGASLKEILQLIEEIIFGICKGYRDSSEKIISFHDSIENSSEFSSDIDVINFGDISIDQTNSASFSNNSAKLFRNIDLIVQKFAISLDAKEEYYPIMIPVQFLKRVGYLQSFPHHAYFVAPARFDRKVLSSVERGRLSSSVLATAEFALSPTVCHHYFNRRQDVPIDIDETVTSLNVCHRHEVSGDHGLERLYAFRMREIIFSGKVEFVEQKLDQCLAWFTGKLREWGISYQVVAALDPFFKNNADSKRLFQAALVLKREVRIRNPISSNMVSVASFNNHRDSLVNSCGITLSGSHRIASSCVGFGYERLMQALYLRFGSDEENWPDELSSRFAE